MHRPLRHCAVPKLKKSKLISRLKKISLDPTDSNKRICTRNDGPKAKAQKTR